MTGLMPAWADVEDVLVLLRDSGSMAHSSHEVGGTCNEGPWRIRCGTMRKSWRRTAIRALVSSSRRVQRRWWWRVAASLSRCGQPEP